VKLPYPPQAYDPNEQARARFQLEQEDAHNFKRDRDVELAGGPRLILRSPDGSRWSITVSNVGVISAVAL
jgi:hypothetical protein